MLGGRITLVMLTFGLTFLPACSKNDNTTLVNTGVDCGLVRNDLFGTWQVSFTPATVTTFNCDTNASFNGTAISVSSTKTYDQSTVIVTGSDGSAAYRVTGDGTDAAVDPELSGSVQADSCLSLFRVWDQTDKAYLICLGIFDRNSRTISAGCDSADMDNPVGSPIEATCDLNGGISATFSVL